MPYTATQCRAFAAKAKNGEKVPSDWKKQCTSAKKKAPKTNGKMKRKPMARKKNKR